MFAFFAAFFAELVAFAKEVMAPEFWPEVPAAA